MPWQLARAGRGSSAAHVADQGADSGRGDWDRASTLRSQSRAGVANYGVGPGLAHVDNLRGEAKFYGVAKNSCARYARRGYPRSLATARRDRAPGGIRGAMKYRLMGLHKSPSN